MSTLAWQFPKDDDHAIRHWIQGNLRTPEGKLVVNLAPSIAGPMMQDAVDMILLAVASDPHIARWGGWDVALCKGKWLRAQSVSSNPLQ